MRLHVALALAIATSASCHTRSTPLPPDADAPLATPTPSMTQPGVSAASSSSSVPAPQPAAASPFEVLAGPVRHRFRKTNLTPDELSRLVRASPELAHVGGDVSFFDPGDTPYLVRSKADREGVTFTTLPLVWRPESGVDVLVVTGRGKAGSFVAAWSLLPGGEYRLASSFVMLGEVAPLALAYRRDEPSLWWTTCWQCPGETGHVSLREDHHIVIVQD